MMGLWLLTACEVVHSTDCIPAPPGQAGCNQPADTGTPVTDTAGETGETTTAGTGTTEVPDTGWPPGEWVAALQWKQRSYDTIQDAISEADDGDTVLVAPGTHFEVIDFHGKGIHVRSTHGATATVIDGGKTGTVVTIRAQEPETAVLEGFTITGGVGDENHGGGVFVENADAIIKHNVFVANDAGIAAAVYFRHGHAELWNNLVVANRAFEGGGGVVCTNCKGGFFYNTIYQNDAAQGPAGEWFYEPQGDLIGNLVVLRDTDTHAFRYMDALGYSFDADYNLLWPEVLWAAHGAEDWPNGEGLVYEEPDFEDVDALDFRLRAGSPGIDQGPLDDVDADGSRADLGAFGGPLGDWSPDAPNHTYGSKPATGETEDSGASTQ